jgi:AmiR/NasT family two-component response regulator
VAGGDQPAVLCVDVDGEPCRTERAGTARLMERQGLSAGDAFDLSRRVSQRMNRKLTDVAERLAETDELPG